MRMKSEGKSKQYERVLERSDEIMLHWVYFIGRVLAPHHYERPSLRAYDVMSSHGGLVKEATFSLGLRISQHFHNLPLTRLGLTATCPSNSSSLSISHRLSFTALYAAYKTPFIPRPAPVPCHYQLLAIASAEF
ncbi:hypothetical protein CROQUDRAFT_93251 [Cronartium quercuum f. sp. fusiforme G11]|uniref:Uncharacterized protein n=1 Tax=Cronartium quercuum f. sp. fusiforme G11 TaxID=708437 RepID=A0A9P6TBQ7_9BASI|nr:hypothetical protein CROQUDRAFT_93251 [Cronartium quercuum f. sp. fusiforme G11]